MENSSLTVSMLQKDIVEKLSGAFTLQEKRQLSGTILKHFLKLSSTELLLKSKEVVSSKIVEEILVALNKINNGKPVQYVLEKTYFYDLELKVDNRALIPRPETEELVDWIVKENNHQSRRILDVGTGSGCIALALQSVLKNAAIVGVDQSNDALSLARENASVLGFSTTFLRADALELEKYLNEKWDVIVSNPPYIPVSESKSMQHHVVQYEPHQALFVPDEEALVFYKAIGRYAFSYLKAKGELFFEINENLPEEVGDLLRQIGFSSVEIRNDLQGKARMVKAVV